jgi:hypothetical protein
VFTLGRIWHASSHGSVVSTDAAIFTARRCCSSDSRLSAVSLTSTAAAAPSQLAEHIGRVLGYAIITSFMIWSTDIDLVCAARGLRVEWPWFLELIAANISSGASP